MRVLLDNNISPRLAPLLEVAGWEVEHVASLGLERADDATVLAAAADFGGTLVSADTDFGALLARSHATVPSVALVRRVVGRRVDALARLLIENLAPFGDELARGCVLVLTDDAVRIRLLPIG